MYASNLQQVSGAQQVVGLMDQECGQQVMSELDDEHEHEASAGASGVAAGYYNTDQQAPQTDVMYQSYAIHAIHAHHKHHANHLVAAAAAHHHTAPHHHHPQQHEQHLHQQQQQHAHLSTGGRHLHHLHHLHQHHAQVQQQGASGAGVQVNSSGYPISSDSSLGSSSGNAFGGGGGGVASSFVHRLQSLVRACCSKKCLFIFCLMLILLIFIFVIALSAYLNFLINSNKTNLSPLSGRLKVLDTTTNNNNNNNEKSFLFQAELTNRTSKEFLAKQQQFEIILRGAFDRAQSVLKSYPNHLVKCEVYAFKPGSLWVYFRLFINKRSLLHDQQLMRRKSKDEHLERDFLPRLTQQTLHSGFEQLTATSTGNSQLERRHLVANARTSTANEHTQREHVKSFDDQINRLMPIIAAIDLSSIQVSAEFDMLQSSTNNNNNNNLNQQSMSDNLRASQFFTTASSVLVATGSSNNNQNLAPNSKRNNSPEYELTPTTSSNQQPATQATTPTSSTHDSTAQSQANNNNRHAHLEPMATSGAIEVGVVGGGSSVNVGDEINVSSKKFTLLKGYKENASRPSTSARPKEQKEQQQQQQSGELVESPFLVNLQHKKQPVSNNSATNQQVSIAKQQHQAGGINKPNGQVVKLISGQPVVSQNNHHHHHLQRTSNSALQQQQQQQQQQTTSTSTHASTSSQRLDDNNNNNNRANFVAANKSANFFSQPTTSTVNLAQQATESNIHRQQQHANNKNSANKTVANDDTVSVSPMIAPYQKSADFSSTPASSTTTTTSSFSALSELSSSRMRTGHQQPALVATSENESDSIEELWKKALNNSLARNNNNQSNKLQTNEQQQQQQQQLNGSNRLITVTTIGAGKSQQQQQQQANFSLNASSSAAASVAAVDSAQHRHQNSNKLAATFDGAAAAAETMRAPSTTTTTTTTSTTTSTPFSSTFFTPTTTPAPQAAAVGSLAAGGHQANLGAHNTLKPKVSPPMKQGGSLISNVSLRQQQQQQQQPSAVLLTRDFLPAANSDQGQLTTTTTTNAAAGGFLNSNAQSRLEKEKLVGQQQQRQKVANNLRTNKVATTNSTTASDQHKQRTSKPTIKHKVKKQQTSTTTSSSLAAGGTNDTTNGAVISASGSSSRATHQQLLLLMANNKPKQQQQQQLNVNHQQNSTAKLSNLRQNKNNNNNNNNSSSSSSSSSSSRTNEPFNFNADHLMPTLPTTIELTRSTSASPSLVLIHTTSPSSSSSSSEQAAPNADYTTTSPAGSTNPGATNSEQATQVKPKQPTLMQSVANKPGTSNFSNQWRPLADEAANEKQPTGTRKPNLSLIVSSERLPATFSAPSSQLSGAGGSQSPFAMSAAILENQLKPPSVNTTPTISRIPPQSSNRPARITNKLSNTYQLVSSSSRSNEFESHRMSRMRQATASVDNSMPPNSTDSSAATSSTTSSSLVLDANTRIVDDFMITTDRASTDQNDRAATLLPQPTPALAKIRAALDLQPKRTRGPFAFETLKAPSAPTTPTLPLLETLELIERAERSPSSSSVVSRQVGVSAHESDAANPKLLVRKRLFIESDGPTIGNSDDQLNPASSSPAVTTTTTASSLSVDNGLSVSDVGPEMEIVLMLPNNTALAEQAESVQLDRTTGGGTNIKFGVDSVGEGTGAIRCTYYGCKAKSSLKFTCLNYTQICDDFIDCQDESDELDCVSLLKHESSAESNKLSFSNGAGIIYLNRKGSLAPMCIDYFEPVQSIALEQHQQQQQVNSSSSGTKLINRIKKQQELIRQINTIGQYACSLQSFSKLVSVKINHHSLVDNFDLIKSSRLYHRLSIINSLDADADDQQEAHDKSQLDAPLGSTFKSGSSEHEVEVSTSDSCPSQRTVFVKCGGFECGQDSFSVIDQNNLAKKRKGGVIINDFPWLVKLYWMGALSCHGYLIDELWLISSSECLANKQQQQQQQQQQQTGGDEERNAIGWSAEISYEHYGNHDYQSIESNRRAIKQILVQPKPRTTTAAPAADDESASSAAALAAAADVASSSIVLAKLEKPVRFSPLNRPICLPLSTINTNNNNFNYNHYNYNKSFDFESGEYKDCVTAALPVASGAAGHQLASGGSAWSSTSPPSPVVVSPTQDLLLTKVSVNRATDCLRSAQGDQLALLALKRLPLDDLICVTELARSKGGDADEQAPSSMLLNHHQQQQHRQQTDATRILICSTTQPTSRSRSKWTVVGVQNNAQALHLHANKRLFTTVSSQINWIVDTMNPKSHNPTTTTTTNTNNSQGSEAVAAADLNPISAPVCNQFKCSTGECLSWSRICDGLYDCSSHEDEKDCHK